MKVKVFFLSASFFLFSIGAYSQSKNVSSNSIYDENGKALMLISVDIETSKPTIKNEYSYNETGNRQSKVLYLWNTGMGKWNEYSRTEYFYNIDDLLVESSFRKWEKKTQAWGNKSMNMIYSYNTTGELRAIEYQKQESIKENYITQK